MLGRARYKQEPKTVTYEKVLCTVNYGEFIFGYKAWSESTGISYQRLRGLVSKLVSDNMIKVSKQTSRYTVYEIINYAKFNSQQSQETQWFLDVGNSQVTVSQQSANSQVTTNKESNKKDKECIPYAEIQKAFNEACVSLPKIKQLTASRKKHLNARLTEINNNIESLYGLFNEIEASDFLTNRKKDNRNDWKADFDWIMNPANFTKILEGKYKNKTSTPLFNREEWFSS